MRRILKYPLKVDDFQVVRMPQGAELLCVKAQRGVPALWALTIDGAHMVDRYIHCYGTGNDFDSSNFQDLRYLGTVLTHDDCSVWHYFVGE